MNNQHLQKFIWHDVVALWAQMYFSVEDLYKHKDVKPHMILFARSDKQKEKTIETKRETQNSRQELHAESEQIICC